MKMNFYESKIAEITLAMKNDVHKAYSLLLVELKMPYIPLKYEVIFNNLKKQLEHKIQDKAPSFLWNIDEILKMLYQSDNKQNVALGLISKHNLHQHRFFLKKRIETWGIKNKIKQSLLFEIMAEQNIDVEIVIDNNQINPTTHSIFKDKQAISAFEYIKKSDDKNIQITEIALMELNKYLLLVFPRTIINGQLLAQQLINIAHYMLEPNIQISKEAQKVFSFLNQHP